MSQSFFQWLVCFMVFTQLGADIAIKIGYAPTQIDWITHAGLVGVTLFVSWWSGYLSKMPKLPLS